MKWLILLVVAVAVVRTSGVEVTFPELARGAQSRIVSGWEATEGQLPHAVSLRMITDVGQVFFCGASIIHSEWALTAAHCTARRQTVVVRVGVTNVTTPHRIFETTEYYSHPLYDLAIAGTVQSNDICLVKFPISIDFNDLVKPIRIQRSGDKDKNYSGLQLTASGWGVLWTHNQTAPDNLHWVYLRGTTNEECYLAHGNLTVVQPNTICAIGYNDTTQSTCQGDSGGPLTIVDEDGQLTLVGITSFVASEGCHVGLPAGFVRPGHYHEWITNITGLDFDWEFATPSTVVPTTTSIAGPTTTSSAEPTTTSIAGPTTTSTAEPSTTSTAEPSTTSTAEPSTTSTAEPSTTSTAEPSTTSTAEPSTTSTAEPSTTSTAEPSTTSTAEPSTTSTAEPSTTSTAEPSTTSTAEPSTTSTAEPSTTSTAEPSTTSTAEPTTTSTAEPTTTSTAEPTTSSIAGPTTTEAAATEEPEAH